jgi:hypothetical protein
VLDQFDCDKPIMLIIIKALNYIRHCSLKLTYPQRLLTYIPSASYVDMGNLHSVTLIISGTLYLRKTKKILQLQ